MNSLSLGGAKNIGYDNSETPADWEGEAQERQRERERSGPHVNTMS